MISPSVMFIEMGADLLKSVPDFIAASQRKELQSFGEVRVQQQIGASGLTLDFQKGYELGLATARAVIAMSPAAAKGGDLLANLSESASPYKGLIGQSPATTQAN